MQTKFLNLAKRFWLLIRAHQWWHFKLPLALAVAYAFAWMNKIPFYSVILPTGLLLLSLISAGIWASIINDFMDLDQDRLAGKSTPMMELEPAARWVALACSLVLNSFVALLLYRCPLSFAILATIWLTFAAYSIPPIRLKERGSLGLLTISLGEHVLLGLLAVTLVLETNGLSLAAVPVPWLLAYLGWSTAYGLRGIIWHQICDIQGDLKSGCKTGGAAYGEAGLKRIGERYVFPFEIMCFILLLGLSRNFIAPLLFAVYAVTEWLRCKFLGCKMVIVAPDSNPRFTMLEFYQIYFPLSFLGLALNSDPFTVFIIVAFVLIFPGALVLMVHQLGHIFRWRAYEPIRRALAKT